MSDSPAPVTLAELRTVDLFDDLDDAALEQWLPSVSVREVAAGDLLTEGGERPTGVQLLFEGVGQALLIDGERAEPAGQHVAPTWIGAIAVLTEGTLGVRMVAQVPCRVGLIQPDEFRRLAFANPVVHTRVMRQVAPVISRIQDIEHNRERLASLGTMAAGLAHELNNPAAAARRAAADMIEAIKTVGQTLDRFVEAGIEREEAAKLLELHHEAIARAGEQTALSALDTADAEDELLDQLEQLGVPEAWRLSAPLAAAGVDRDWLDRVAALAGPATDAALGWTAAVLTARGLAQELEESTGRMSKLVGAVKTYAYMDRGELVEVDLHEGLETTLVVLGHRLKHVSIEVMRNYDRELPKLTVRGSELNQVWTNLLDNAIDALGESGTITITTRLDGNCVEVEVADDGPGIPGEIQDRIYDSFFTTKDVGHGTGLGLATAHRIVVDRHGGSLSVESAPGRTAFLVRLPLRPNGA